ncbi:right-handed parallel beta-helix repeat-containing protein [Ktedonosporobacter rubrisoli]|uniref:Right-handed parallel beta-helix repeat-containing protein n=1 Tax=Ktedonosporobacter rubrisoli TaxID=2509675 RepID=A0A4P6K5V5_KTERU|nr:right-handed parallel beta-helix repeat-containing protein [Ktedonosporobacter rubrisoli]
MPQHQFYVAPQGKDCWPGTYAQPFATLQQAQQHVRANTANQRSDIIVNLRAGTYFLATPLQFLAASGDSGEHGYDVIYQAYGYGTNKQEHVVLSGGREISGWQPYDEDSAIWQAEVGDLNTRQLFVDGQQAQRASLPSIPTLTRTETGYVVHDTTPQSWRSPADIEFVYQGIYPWSSARCGVASITGDQHSTTITMDQPAFSWANQLYTVEGRDRANWTGLGSPTAIENSVSFLTQPGTFALDRSRPGHHILFYMPRPGEDLARVSVIAPLLETLVSGQGTAEAPLHNLSLRGITFAHATWLQPSKPEGFLHYHGITYYNGGHIETVIYDPETQSSVTVPSDPARMPGNVTFSSATHILIEGCRFSHLGANALEFSKDCQDNLIRGNVIHDVSAAGIVIGTGASSRENRGNRIENNWVHHTGLEYHGSPAIYLAETQDSTIVHNQINDVPHCGIVVYGGSTARNTSVLNNLVFNTMKVLADGGGIYISSNQGASFASGTVVRGNVIHDTITSYNFGLYVDYGASWVTMQANVVYNSDTPTALQVEPPLQHVAFIGNFWDMNPDGYDNPPEYVTVAGNTRLPRDGFEPALLDNPASADIVTNAGLEPSYLHLLQM